LFKAKVDAKLSPYMLYLPINRSWIVSRRAQHVYFACAIAVLSLIGTYFAARMALFATGKSLVPGSPAVLILQVLLSPGIFGTALLSVAMWYFWFGFDRSGWLKKTIWFVPLYFFLPLGPVFYYFWVYRRSEMLER
jgi:hypothetical protein